MTTARPMLIWMFVGALIAAQDTACAQSCQHHWIFGSASGPPAYAIYDSGAGPTLYGAGEGAFQSPVGTIVAQGVARWAGDRWESIGDLLSATAYTLAVYDDGTGPQLYVGGGFLFAGGVASRAIARFDGRSWSAVNAQWIWPPFGGPVVGTMEVYDDGSGPALVVAGWFGGAGGVPSPNIVRWDGKTWSGFAGGLTSGGSPFDMAVFDDDGAGPNAPALYVCGGFDGAGAPLTHGIAKWDGQAWHALGMGINPGSSNLPVHALAVYDDGSGPALYLAGCFEGAGGVPGTKHLARWNGTAWSSVAPTINGQCATALLEFDDGHRGPGLIVGGDFTSIAGLTVQRLARFDGSGWSNLGDGPESSWIRRMTRFDESAVPTLWVSGAFQVAPGQLTGIGRYQYVCEPCYADCDGSGALTIADFTCFQSKYAAADPAADCNASGNLSIADFGCFQTKYVLGCP